MEAWEWQKASLEEASFNSSQVGGRIFPKAPLLPTRFLALLELSPQLSPALIIPGEQVLHRKDLLFAGHGSHAADRPANHHARNGSPPACGASLVDTHHPE